MKTTLSTVQAIVGWTARSAKSIEEFYQDFTGRVISLANTHTLLTEELWQKASLRDLVHAELRHYENGEARVNIAGPAIELPSEVAVPLGMALHELTTNAAKYGSLSSPEGRLSIEWSVHPEGDQPHVAFGWIEEGGPIVDAPKRRGFGTQLLQRC